MPALAHLVAMAQNFSDVGATSVIIHEDGTTDVLPLTPFGEGRWVARVAGTPNGFIALGDGPFWNQHTDVARYDAEGNLLWTWATAGTITVWDACGDSQGNVYLWGFFASEGGFRIVHLDPDGNPVVIRPVSLGSDSTFTGTQFIHRIAVAPDETALLVLGLRREWTTTPPGANHGWLTLWGFPLDGLSGDGTYPSAWNMHCEDPSTGDPALFSLLVAPAVGLITDFGHSLGVVGTSVDALSVGGTGNGVGSFVFYAEPDGTYESMPIQRSLMNVPLGGYYVGPGIMLDSENDRAYMAVAYDGFEAGEGAELFVVELSSGDLLDTLPLGARMGDDSAGPVLPYPHGFVRSGLQPLLGLEWTFNNPSPPPWPQHDPGDGAGVVALDVTTGDALALGDMPIEAYPVAADRWRLERVVNFGEGGSPPDPPDPPDPPHPDDCSCGCHDRIEPVDFFAKLEPTPQADFFACPPEVEPPAPPVEGEEGEDEDDGNGNGNGNGGGPPINM